MHEYTVIYLARLLLMDSNGPFYKQWCDKNTCAFFKSYLFIYLAAWGLSCGTDTFYRSAQALHRDVQASL